MWGNRRSIKNPTFAYDLLQHLQTSCIMEDAIRPNNERLRTAYEQGHRNWHSLYLRAKQEPGLPQFCFQFQRAFQQQPRFSHNLDLKQSYGFVYAVGVSSWETGTSYGHCRIPSFEQRLDISVSVNRPTSLVLRDGSDHTSNYSTWFDREDNHLSVLILAWAYILSARWAELMPESTVRYTDSQAKWNGDESANSIVVDIGDVNEERARWWAAILAPGEGWQADITSGQDRYRSPWSIAFQGGQNFVLSCRQSPLSRDSTVVSFRTALCFLSDYCTLHDVADQGIAALSAALFLPFLNDGKAVSLPSLITHGACQIPTISSRNNVQFDFAHEAHQVDKLLTLSCNIKGIRALLSSTFYEPGITCNFVSPWLQSTFAFLDSVRNDHLLLARILMNRTPNIAFLWLGGVIMGAHEEIMQECRFGLMAIDLHAAVWSGTIQSFMQEPVSKYSKAVCNSSDSSILRSDECRLLFLTQAENHTRFPICPWVPFGETALGDTDLDVRFHTGCGGDHALKYGGWKWVCKHGAVVQSDSSTPIPPGPPKPKQWDGPLESYTPVSFEALDLEEESASENATRSIFGWLRFEGYPPAERDIHEHPWVKIDDSEDEEELADIGENSQLPPSSTPAEAWIDRQCSNVDIDVCHGAGS